MLTWPVLLIIFFGGLIIMMMSGMPVAFGFLLINIIAAWFLWGGSSGLDQLIFNTFTSVTQFSFLPIPMFILMGEIMFRSGTATAMIKAVDKWMGRVPGRLSLLAVASGTLIATLTGASMASVAMLGQVLVPQMQAKGYNKSMILGPILGSGGLAIMIPPSSLAVLVGAIGEISIGKILIAIIIPGLMMAVIMAAYIVLRCKLQPSLAPADEVKTYPLGEKLRDFVFYILPIAIVVFLVIGIMMLGIATPTEAAVTGAIGTIILAAIYKKFNLNLFKISIAGAIEITVMIFMMIVTASTFSQVLAFTGASTGLTELASELSIAPILIVIAMQVVVLILGCFMDVGGILLITLPIFMPIINALHVDPVWFAVMLLINVQVAAISPPFGLNLFVMKGVVGESASIGEIYKSGAIYSGLSVLAMALILVFPPIAMWLPGLMRPIS
jgi:tripartite ATP-independent transporter DctM subunit